MYLRKKYIGELFNSNIHADKYFSKNPISKYLVTNFMASILTAVKDTGKSEVHEVGCGEGHIIGMLSQFGYQVRGSDISQAALSVARSESARLGISVPLKIKSIYDLDPSEDSSDLILCCEVLEHLTDPELALDKLLSVTKNDLIVSVPREPLWHILNLARGKYLYALGNTPGHYNHWTRSMFINFLSKKFEIISIKNPIPWTIVHCKPKKNI